MEADEPRKKSSLQKDENHLLRQEQILMYKATVLKEERANRMRLRHGIFEESPKKKKRVSFVEKGVGDGKDGGNTLDKKPIYLDGQEEGNANGDTEKYVINGNSERVDVDSESGNKETDSRNDDSEAESHCSDNEQCLTVSVSKCEQNREDTTESDRLRPEGKSGGYREMAPHQHIAI